MGGRLKFTYISKSLFVIFHFEWMEEERKKKDRKAKSRMKSDENKISKRKKSHER